MNTDDEQKVRRREKNVDYTRNHIRRKREREREKKKLGKGNIKI